MKTLASVLAMALALAAAPAGAATPRQEAQLRNQVAQLGPVDANGDAQISMAEAQTFNARAFQVADTNRDGTLTQGEFTAFRAALADRLATRLATQRFDVIDTDKDGRVSQQEYDLYSQQAFQSALRSGGVAPGAPPTPGPGTVQLGVRSSSIDDLEPFDQIDQDENGTISFDEWRIPSDRDEVSNTPYPNPAPGNTSVASIRRSVSPSYNFIAIDKNNDGVIDQQEYEAGRYGQQTAQVPVIGGTVPASDFWTYQ